MVWEDRVVPHDGSEGLSPQGWLPDRVSVGARAGEPRGLQLTLGAITAAAKLSSTRVRTSKGAWFDHDPESSTTSVTATIACTAHAPRDQPFSASGAWTVASESRQAAATGSVRCPSSAAFRSAATVSSEGRHLRGSPSPASP